MNWTQLCTILWLRWRLSRNQFHRGGAITAVLSIIAMVIAVVMVFVGGVGGLLAGAIGLAKARPETIMLVWDALVGAFLFLWLIGVIAEIQRSESIDLPRLLHLPVSLRGVFVMNYLASHFNPILMFALSAALGLSLGLTWSNGLVMVLLVPLVLTFTFMVTAWTYCLRGWLVALTVNPRKRRNVIMVITLSFVLLSQAPNLYFNVYLRHRAPRPPAPQTVNNSPGGANPVQTDNKPKGIIPPAFLAAHNYVPVLWVPKGARALAEGNAWPAIWGSLGALLLGVAGLAQAYRSTLRFYLGAEKTGPARPRAVAPVTGVPRRNFLEKQVPLVSDDVAALALATFRGFTRAPEVKMALFTNILVLVALAGVMFAQGGKTTNVAAQLFIGVAAVGITFFGLIQLMFNQFGYDRDGFRALVLLPTRRRDVLLGKNLALVPVVLFLGLGLLALLAVLARLPILVVLAAGFQLLAMFLLLCIVGNFLSALVPYRISAGSLKPAKPPLKVVLIILVAQFFLPVLMIPVFIPPALGMLSAHLDWLPGALVDAILSLLLLELTLFLYRAALNPLGRLLDRREKQILQVVCQENE
jgi:ABC-2 type transport system permease protein